jgi:outer membrane biosynthesis protein TonB
MMAHRAILCLTVIVSLFPLSLKPAVSAEKKRAMIYKPRIPWPTLPNGRKPEGSGVFVCHVDTKTGLVKHVSVAKSTGYTILDKAGIESFSQARFRGSGPLVYVPITWSHKKPRR